MNARLEENIGESGNWRAMGWRTLFRVRRKSRPWMSELLPAACEFFVVSVLPPKLMSLSTRLHGRTRRVSVTLSH